MAEVQRRTGGTARLPRISGKTLAARLRHGGATDVRVVRIGPHRIRVTFRATTLGQTRSHEYTGRTIRSLVLQIAGKAP